jgi:hypothetical protein
MMLETNGTSVVRAKKVILCQQSRKFLKTFTGQDLKLFQFISRPHSLLSKNRLNLTHTYLFIYLFILYLLMVSE